MNHFWCVILGGSLHHFETLPIQYLQSIVHKPQSAGDQFSLLHKSLATWCVRELKLRWLVNHMDVSKNRGTPKSSILIGVSLINHPFWGFSPYFWKHPHNFSPTSYWNLSHWSRFPLQHPPFLNLSSGLLLDSSIYTYSGLKKLMVRNPKP